MAEAILPSTSSSTGVEQPSLSLNERPTCLICLGMAGSGKTTFIQVTSTLLSYQSDEILSQRVNAYLHARKSPPYVINLDPAVHSVPYPVNIG